MTPGGASRARSIHLDMVEDAIMVRDKGGFFEEILERLRSALERLRCDVGPVLRRERNKFPEIV